MGNCEMKNMLSDIKKIKNYISELEKKVESEIDGLKNKSKTDTSYKLTAVQNRVLSYCITKSCKVDQYTYKSTVYVKDLRTIIHGQNQKTSSSINKVFNELMTSTFNVKTFGGSDIDCKSTFILSKKFNKENASFEILFSKDVYDYMTEYSSKTLNSTYNISNLKSFYSQRLYEFLYAENEKFNNKITLNLERLRFIFGVDSTYPEYRNFKQRVLNQAIREINEYSDIFVDFEEIKEIRRVSSIRFNVNNK